MDLHAEGERRSEASLALIERLDRHGNVLQSMRVSRWPVRIGRALDADLVPDDPFLAPHHAELDLVDGEPRLKLGQTLNGAQVCGHSLKAAGETATLTADEAGIRSWRMGTSTWRLRLATDALAPEQPLAPHHAAIAGSAPMEPAWRLVLPLLLAAVLAQLFDRWLDNNPGTPANTYISAGLGTLGMTMGWALLWSLGNKLFLGRLDFKVHLRLVLLFSLAWTALAAALPLLAYAMDWSALSRATELVTSALICALIWSHLVWIMPAHRKGLLAGIVGLYLTGVGLSLWINHQRSGLYFSERYVSALPPPGWRLVGMQPVSTLIDDARRLKAGLDQQAAQDSDEDESAFVFEE